MVSLPEIFRFSGCSLPLAGLAQMCLLCAMLFGCRGTLLYTRDELQAFQERRGFAELFFETRSGRQSAFYVPPTQEPRSIPERLVIMYPGIASRALDWLAIIKDIPPAALQTTGFLLIDYPGRGNSCGSLRIHLLDDSSRGALDALGRYLNVNAQCNRKSPDPPGALFRLRSGIAIFIVTHGCAHCADRAFYQFAHCCV